MFLILQNLYVIVIGFLQWLFVNCLKFELTTFISVANFKNEENFIFKVEIRLKSRKMVLHCSCIRLQKCNSLLIDENVLGQIQISTNFSAIYERETGHIVVQLYLKWFIYLSHAKNKEFLYHILEYIKIIYILRNVSICSQLHVKNYPKAILWILKKAQNVFLPKKQNLYSVSVMCHVKILCKF